MFQKLTRRGFLQVGGLGLASAALKPPPPRGISQPLGLGRVADTVIGLYQEPNFNSDRLDWLPRDTLVSLINREMVDEGPAHNPLWYRIPDGYLHSGNIQVVRWEPQPPHTDIPEGGGIFETSVPFTRTYRKPDPASTPLYRLYYQSIHWVVDLVEGVDGRPWYELLDDLLAVKYYARAEHLRRIAPEELAPLSPEIPEREKRIEVSLSAQELRAFENDRLVFRTRISSGIPDSRPKSNGIPTVTPTGNFNITQKMPLRHMGDGHLTGNLEAYELPGVPWVSYFTSTGVAFHGTYWHSDYGRPRSHGCINMRPEEALWIFRWSTPPSEPDLMLNTGYGTKVFVY
ncbi:MAG: murein L,D-transpeptidase [Anaerolineales bacterium]|nr:MAG: murein L,D-transpeptidase [Anaerolineales bacterium]